MATGSGKVWKLILQCPGFQAKSEHPVLSRRRGPIQQVFICLSTYIRKSVLKPGSLELHSCNYLRYCTTSVNTKCSANDRKVSQSLIQNSGSPLKQGLVAESKIQCVDAKQEANTASVNKKSKRSNGRKARQSDAKQEANTTSVNKKSKRSNGTKTRQSDAKQEAKTTSVNKRSKRSDGRKAIQSLIQNSGSTLRQGVVAKSKIQSVDAKQKRNTTNVKRKGEGGNLRKASQSSVQTSRSTVEKVLETQSSVQTSRSTVEQVPGTKPTIQSVDAEQEAKMILQFLGGHLTYREYIGKLQNQLINAWANAEEISQILNQEASTLNTPGIHIFLGLLNTLEPRPRLALEVFNWKRTRSDMTIDLHEYSKSIILAGRAKDVDLAVELFSEIESRGIKKETSVYNALMTAYVCNGLTPKTLALFDDLKRDPDCSPTIVTYNILLSTFGRSMLVEHMEMVKQAIEESSLPPNIYTYNTLIAGYLTAWMWDEMEEVFRKMERCSVEPNCSTYSLLVRGYAFSGQLKKMEEAFDHLKGKIYEKDVPIIRAMIHAYFKSTDAEKITKIENLLKFIPENEYRPWIDVILIVLYAQADAVEKMETSIIRALSRCTMITTTSVTRSVTTTYFKHDALDKLEAFVKQTKTAGWKLCRSVYHGRMVMYGFQNRLSDMENVMEEMMSSGFSPVKKTFLILYKIYIKFRKEDEVKWTLKRMKNAGFDLPEDSKILADGCFAEILD